MSRCVCGHPADVHTHYRAGLDCGECGRGRCPWFADLARRDELYDELTPAQQVALARSDAHFERNLRLLAEFTPNYRARAAQLRSIPAQRRRPTVAHEMELRRVARTEQCRRRRNEAR